MLIFDDLLKLGSKVMKSTLENKVLSMLHIEPSNSKNSFIGLIFWGDMLLRRATEYNYIFLKDISYKGNPYSATVAQHFFKDHCYQKNYLSTND